MNSSPEAPKVSIGLPVYNGENYIKDAIDSILNQTFTDFELIISDNASIDQTAIICRTYADKDPRIRYYRVEQNQGAAWNFNRVFELSRGEYFKWAAHDDICAPNFLKECVAILDAYNQVVLCFPRASRNINSEGEVVENWLIIEYGRLENDTNLPPQHRFKHILMHSVWSLEFYGLFRASSLRQTSLFRKGAVYGHFGGSDKVLLAELSLLGKFYPIDQDLFYRRFHPNQITALDTLKRKKQIAPNSSRFPPAPLKAFQAYLQSVYTAPLGIYEKLACYAAIAQLALRMDKLKKLFVLDSNNYFGFNLPNQKLRKKRLK